MHEIVMPNPGEDYPDIASVDYPEPEEGVTQNDDDHAGPPQEEVST